MTVASGQAPDFRAAFDRVAAYVERRWDIPVVITDVPSTFTGDLDGAGIWVDYDLEAEEALFIVAHLFGHTVQWNLSERGRELGTLAVVPGQVAERELEALAQYEVEAARYSLQLFHDAGIGGLDQWLSEFSDCDIAYLLHYYRTGEKRPVRSFWRSGVTCLTPLPIPDFRPTRWVSRAAGVVV